LYKTGTVGCALSGTLILDEAGLYDHRTLTQEQKAQILALAEDFPRLWKDAGTSDRDRKRMARLILEDVTLIRDRTLITAHVRFKGGATRVLSVPMPPRHRNCARPRRKSSPR
jgi:hypothetical protein